VLDRDGMNPEQIGKVTNNERVVEIKYQNKRMILN